MYESTFERKLCAYIKSLGGKAYKWVSPGAPGCLTESRYCRGTNNFIEVKRPGRSDGLSIRQKKVIATLEGLGCTVWRISDMEDLKARLRADGV